MALLVTKKCINCDICEPECPNEVTSTGGSVYEIDNDKCMECAGHYDAPTCQKARPTSDTTLKDPVHVEIEEQLWDRFALMRHADKFQPRYHLAMKPLPCPCNKRIACRPGKMLRAAVRHHPESNFR